MLVELGITNYRSIGLEQHLSFGSGGRHPLSVIVEPADRGCSTLVASLSALQKMVLHSTALSDDAFETLYTPHARRSGKSVQFFIQLQLSRTNYRYKLCFECHRITAETLDVERAGRWVRWFGRH